uniref:Uncharacterized protein n=1 Tax=Panagrolaimus sp. ES5 TaxID=591445 RepID=A0AC34FPU0_9BILA
MNHHILEIVKKAYLSVSILAENEKYRDIFHKEEIIEKFIHLLKSFDKNIQKTALLIIGNTINDGGEQFMIDNGVLKFMPNILKCSDREIVKLAINVFQNLIVGSKTKISKSVDPKLIPLIVDQLS